MCTSVSTVFGIKIDKVLLRDRNVQFQENNVLDTFHSRREMATERKRRRKRGKD